MRSQAALDAGRDDKTATANLNLFDLESAPPSVNETNELPLALPGR
jgi:hypothetical protein